MNSTHYHILIIFILNNSLTNKLFDLKYENSHVFLYYKQIRNVTTPAEARRNKKDDKKTLHSYNFARNF